MNTVQPNNLEKFITLKLAAEKLGVSIATLLSWNEHNILKPMITQTGEVGYLQEQIDQFITIRQLTGAAGIGLEKITPLQNIVLAGANTVRETPKPETNGPVKANKKHFSPPFILSFVALLLLVTFGVVTKQGGLNLLPGKNTEHGEKVLGVQTSKLKLPGQIIASLPIEFSNETTLKKNLQNEGEGVSKQQITAPTLYKTKTEKNIASSSQQLLVSTTMPGQTPGPMPSIETSYSSTTFFQDTCTSCIADKDSAIDERGNIRGETKTDTLAMLVGGLGGMVEGESFKQTNTDQTNQMLFLFMSAVAAIFVFQKQLAYSSTKKPSRPQTDPYTNPNALTPQKILEVDQKTDGTVVLSFQGKEYKISKPELYSESDQFIERLMKLSQSDADSKEIEYDILKQENNKLVTPLSRLVTRLGFVGIKRDLFFPRTSKHRVLFRRFLTQQDLTAMNLTTEQILEDLTTAN